MLGLAAGAEQGIVPGRGAASAVPFVAFAFPFVGRGGENQFIVLPLDALLGFQHERAAAVQIDPAVRLRAVGVQEHHAALEDVGVVIVVGDRGIGGRHREQVAQFAQKKLVVRVLRAAGRAPTGDEVFSGVARHVVSIARGVAGGQLRWISRWVG